MPASSSVAFKPAVSLTDETFDPARRSGYALYLTLGPTGAVRVGIADIARNQFLVLEDYPAPATPGPETAASHLAELAAQHPWLGLSGWQSIRLALIHERFTLLPTSLFRLADAPALLALHCPFDPAQEAALAYQHPGPEITSVFAVPRALLTWLDGTYGASAVQVLHHTSALLEGVLHQAPLLPEAAHGGAALRLSFDGAGLLTLTVTRQQKIVYCNVFAFSSSEDAIYYVILILQELELNPETVAVTVWGDLTHDSALFAILRRYLRHVRFGHRPQDVQFSYRFDDGAFPHRYFDLFSLHLGN